jgi:hypothetical protein
MPVKGMQKCSQQARKAVNVCLQPCKQGVVSRSACPGWYVYRLDLGQTQHLYVPLLCCDVCLALSLAYAASCQRIAASGVQVSSQPVQLCPVTLPFVVCLVLQCMLRWSRSTVVASTASSKMTKE